MKTVKNNLITIVSLALFNFVFLCTEYVFDDVMAHFVDAKSVVIAQNVILGASVIGFVGFYFVNGLCSKSRKTRVVYGLLILMLTTISTLVVCEHASASQVYVAGIIDFIVLGLIGSNVCYKAICEINDKEHLATIVGISYALGILIQFINNNLVRNSILQGVVLCIAIVVIVIEVNIVKENTTEALAVKSDNVIDNGETAIFSLQKALLLVAMVAALTCIFATLDNAVTLVHAAGGYNIGRFARLFLAVSGLLSGVLYDLKDRKYMNHIMYGVALVSAVCVVVLTLGGSFVIGLVVFYISAGFFVVYFMTSFMDLSVESDKPALWAGIGRGVNNAVAIVISVFSLVVLNPSSMRVMIINIVLFALISMLFFAIIENNRKQLFALNSLNEEDTTEVKSQINNISEEEKVSRFAEEYKLTAREIDVLNELLSAEENVQNIASNLNISRAALYRHINNINEKTETKSRIGLVKKFYTW